MKTFIEWKVAAKGEKKKIHFSLLPDEEISSMQQILVIVLWDFTMSENFFFCFLSFH